ncbi:hypothetical protein FNF29_03492 [Cafeteria roenbergensis]|nr:hypothetical protein FNF29_03492 [Cafeteria roenbergensis]|eukprot:KAA0152969.1 hypothetical protein FNF29_03492 [Cafeteria roenbergensis]
MRRQAARCTAVAGAASAFEPSFDAWRAAAATAAVAVAAFVAGSVAHADDGGASLPAACLEELRDAVGAANVSDAEEDRAEFGRDKYSHHHGPPPAAVVRPGSTAEVSAVLKACHRHGVPVVAFGSGTSLEGHTVPSPAGIVLAMDRMDGVVRLDAAGQDVTVQAGCVKDLLNEQLRPHGLFFPVDPGPGATIGGMCATGCSGTNAVRFGTMKDNVLALTAVLADGTVLTTGGRARKSSAGYDLARLLVGSEGTLAVITEATLRLRPLPETTAVAVAAFPTVGDAAAAVMRLLREGVEVSCVELLDDGMIRVINEQSGFDHAVAPTLFFKFAGSPEAVKECAARTADAIRHHGADGWRWASDPKEVARLWQARKVALWSAQSAHPEMEVAITDVCVPVSRLAEAVTETKADIDASLLAGRAPIVGHVGDGNFHTFLTFDAHNPVESQEAERLNDRMVKRAIRLGGTCTGEHGIGLGKRKYLEEEIGEGGLHAMRLLKAALDPRNILNPGKVL